MNIVKTYIPAHFALNAGPAHPIEPTIIFVPTWTKFVAFDKNGNCYAFSAMPVPDITSDSWDSIGLTRYEQLASIDGVFEKWDGLFYAIDADDYDGENPLRYVMLGV